MATVAATLIHLGSHIYMYDLLLNFLKQLAETINYLDIIAMPQVSLAIFIEERGFGVIFMPLSMLVIGNIVPECVPV